MSFMRGFAQGFVKSYSEVQKQEAEKEALVEKALLERFLTAKAKYDKDATEDAERVRQARSIVGEFNNVPAEAWTNVYNWLSQGRTIDAIRTDLTTGKFTRNAPAAPAAGAAPSAGTTDGQMEGSGLAAGDGNVRTFSVSREPAAAAGTATNTGSNPPANTGSQTPPAGNTGGGSKPPAAKPGFFETLKAELTATPADRARRSVAQIAGGEQNVTNVMGGYRPRQVTNALGFAPKVKDDTLTAGELAAEIAKLQTEALSGDPKAVKAWEEYSAKVLPVKINALRTASPEKKDDLVAAYDDVQTAIRENNPEKIDAARRRLNDLVQLKRSASGGSANSEPTTFIRIGQNGRPEYTQGSRVNNPDGVKLLGSDGKELNPANGWRVQTRQEEEAYDAIYKTRNADIVKYNTDMAGTADALRLGGQIMQIVDKDPRVLTRVASMVKSVQGAATEVNTAFNVIGNMLKDGNTTITLPQLEQSLRASGVIQRGETLEQFANRPVDMINIGTDAKALASATSVFQSKLLLAAFRVGGLEGQGGNAMSNKDFDRIIQIVQSSKDANAFANNFGDYLYGRVQNLSDRYQTLSTDLDGAIASFKERYGYNPLARVPTIEQLIDSRKEPEVKAGFREAMYRRVGYADASRTKLVYQHRMTGEKVTFD